MSYYWFSRQELLQKVKDKCHDCGACQKKKKKQKKNMERTDTEI